MKREEIDKKVVSAIADVLGCDMCDISQQSNLVEDLGADSLDGVEILMQVETDLDFEMSTDDYYLYVNQAKTVKDVCDLIEKYVNQ